MGLEHTFSLLDFLKNPQENIKIIHIAGTNGKGSSLAILEAILRKEGVRTGAYSSPHVHRYNERTLIDGVPADDATIIKALETVEAARGNTRLTGRGEILQPPCVHRTLLECRKRSSPEAPASTLCGVRNNARRMAVHPNKIRDNMARSFPVASSLNC